MTDVDRARIATHRLNLMRYRQILATPLADAERAYITQRMLDTLAELERLEQVASGGPPSALSA